MCHTLRTSVILVALSDAYQKSFWLGINLTLIQTLWARRTMWKPVYYETLHLRLKTFDIK